MKIILSSDSEKQLRKLTKIDQIAVARKIRGLTENFSGEEKLSGYKLIYRVRVGNFRIVYRKLKNEIYVILIRHRKDVYEMLKQMLK